MTLENLTKRLATREVQGVSFPAIINNWTYHLADMFVYEDGLIDCSGIVDLPLFKKKVRRGWVVSEIPDGESLGIHHLGEIQITKAKWDMRAGDLVKRAKGIIAELNPQGRNLYKMYGDPIDRSGKIPIPKIQPHKGTWKFKSPDSPFQQKITGGTKYCFMRDLDSIRLVQISIFEDDSVRITGLEQAVDMKFSELTSSILEGRSFEYPAAGQKVIINGLVEFVAGEVQQFIDTDGLIGELTSLQRDVKGLPNAVNICARAFTTYCEDPSHDHLESLREKYEAVPAHMRCYCGDMDTKDIPIRMALYGEREIENWSHWAAAKQRGESLPRIDVPKPRK